MSINIIDNILHISSHFKVLIGMNEEKSHWMYVIVGPLYKYELRTWLELWKSLGTHALQESNGYND